MPNVGDRVLAVWPVEQNWWYPGVVCAASEGYEIQYDDGDRGVVEVEQIRPLDIRVGSRVYGRWQGGGAYYPGRVAEVVGHALHIHYDDGDREWSSVSMLRMHQDDLA
jgi:hypothetical protein